MAFVWGSIPHSRSSRRAGTSDCSRGGRRCRWRLGVSCGCAGVAAPPHQTGARAERRAAQTACREVSCGTPYTTSRMQSRRLEAAPPDARQACAQHQPPTRRVAATSNKQATTHVRASERTQRPTARPPLTSGIWDPRTRARARKCFSECARITACRWPLHLQLTSGEALCFAA